MPLSIPSAVPGARVEHYFIRQEPKFPGDPGKIVKNPIRRRGYITKVDYLGGEYDNTAVKAVWVKFEEGKDPERMELALLNLVKKSNMAIQERLKTDEQNYEAEKVRKMMDIHESPVQDKTGLDSRKRLSPDEARKMAMK